MKKRAMEEFPRYPSANQYERVLSYFLENYDGLSLFLSDPTVSTDNNAQENGPRNTVQQGTKKDRIRDQQQAHEMP